MTSALALPANLSLIEISAAASAPWRQLFATPSHTHIPYRAGTQSERNLLGARLDAAVTRAEGADGGPLVYRVRHHVDLWAADGVPKLQQEIVEGTPPLAT